MAYLAKINKSTYINFKLMLFMSFKFLVKCIFFFQQQQQQKKKKKKKKP